MAANNLTNNLKVLAENSTNLLTDSEFLNSIERSNGFQPGTPISSKLVNTTLRQATLVTTALVDALKQLAISDLTNSITVGKETTLAGLTAALVDALTKVKVSNAAIADNVKSGAVVEETTRARESKPGYPLNKTLNQKTVFKGVWVGTHKNGDILYYGVDGSNKGFYIVKGLAEESVDGVGNVTTHGTITLTASHTPTGEFKNNLHRLTIESTIGADVNLSKVDALGETPTTNQLVTALALKSLNDSLLLSIGIKVAKVEGKQLSTNDYTTDEKNKLAGIEAGAQKNVATNLTITKAADKITVNSSTGDDTAIPLVDKTNTFAGLMSPTDKTKLDGIESGAQKNVGTNITIGTSATSVQIQSSTGDDAYIYAPIPTGSAGAKAGIMTADDKLKLNELNTQAELDTKFSNKRNTYSEVTLVPTSAFFDSSGYDIIRNYLPANIKAYDRYVVVLWSGGTEVVMKTVEGSIWSFGTSIGSRVDLVSGSDRFSCIVYTNRVHILSYDLGQNAQAWIYAVER